MPEKYCNDIEVFAPLHDIGKVGILDSLLLAERNLLPSEFEVMKTHTVLGHNIVKGKKELEMVAAITIAHHEWYDGSGYPKGLKGLDIPLSAG
jgi:HD-GYP domain-containing protein (c-di-GMP phosphodiesterase class II)